MFCFPHKWKTIYSLTNSSGFPMGFGPTHVSPYSYIKTCSKCGAKRHKKCWEIGWKKLSEYYYEEFIVEIAKHRLVDCQDDYRRRKLIR